MNLSDKGYDCACVFDGNQVADTTKRERFDLVLLDVMILKSVGFN